MAKISEITSDDGSNGGDPNKKPQEEKIKNEKPKQQVQNLPIQVGSLRIPHDLPDEINESILARIPRDRYPKLYLTSKAVGQIITSPRLFETRSDLGRTEHVLYTFIGFPPFDFPSWYILHRRNDSLRLSKIGSLPPMFPGSAVVTIGHDMYLIGGYIAQYKPVKTVIVIDCRFHTWRYLPNMERARYLAAAGVIDGKIYVIGGCTKRYGDWVQVFDVNSETWKTVHGPHPKIALDGEFAAYVVMEDKIYILDGINCLSYEPRRRIWEYWGIERPQRWFWHGSSCVVDDMLYTIDPLCCYEYPIVVFDPRNVGWRPVKGVARSDLGNLVYAESKMANFGGKLVILGRNQSMYCFDYFHERDIWCIVITLERREDGEIWGNVESNSRVLACLKLPLIELCRTVTV